MQKMYNNVWEVIDTYILLYVKLKISLCFQIEIFDQCVFPVMKYVNVKMGY